MAKVYTALQKEDSAGFPPLSERRVPTTALAPLPRALCRAVAAAGMVAALVAPAAALLLGRRRGAVAELRGVEKKFDVLEKLDVLDVSLGTYKRVLGDPYTFTCPPPGLGGLAEEVDFKASTCCEMYSALGWPYQFPECRNTLKCPSCFKKTAHVDLRKHPAAPSAAVAWAASLSVYEKAKSKSGLMHSFENKVMKAFGHIGDDSIKSHRLTADIGQDGSSTRSDLCPSIHDWEETMLNDDSDNLHARVLKSPSRKLAVLVFRGTEMTSMKNWEVDADLKRTTLDLGDGYGTTEVHEGFLHSLQRVLPRVKKWLVGSALTFREPVPTDWTVVFTGHSLGGALATLAATMAELDGWSRKPDATIVFGAPRVADGQLSEWWRRRGLCSRLLRVNTYNDVIHYMPLKTAFSMWEVAGDLLKCASDIKACMAKVPSSLMSGGDSLTGSASTFSTRWDHLCGEESEVMVESATKGINDELESFSLLGGALAHMIDSCKYGYSFGVLRSGLAEVDGYCGVSGAAVCGAGLRPPPPSPLAAAAAPVS